jgi:hypothetical protein
MKKTVFNFLVAIISSFAAFGQTEPFLPDTFALETIIVEKYYVSNADDNPDGTIPEGSITYRIYADLKPDYRVSGISGFVSPNVHPLNISVTDGGQFYNNMFGASLGPEVNSLLFDVDERVALDSYITIGAASTTHFGIPKYLDQDEESIISGSPQGYLFNDVSLVCPPTVQEQDGYFAGTVPSLSSVGIPLEQIQRLGTMNSEGSFELTNGSWFNPEGVLGPTEENIVLLGQITTIGGLLDFDLNILVRIPEELQCNVIPSCNKSSIVFTAIFTEGDNEHNQNPQSNNVHYQRDDCNYTDDGADCILSVDNSNDLINSFGAFPNPTLNELNISFSENLSDVEYTLIDVNGRIVYSVWLGRVENGSRFSLDISNLEQGTYVLQVRSKDKNGSKKIVKL